MALRKAGYKVTRPTVTRWEDDVHLPKQEAWPYLEKVLDGARMRDIFFGAPSDEDAEEVEFLNRMRGFYQALDARGRRAVIGLAQQQIRDVDEEKRAAAALTSRATEGAALFRTGGEDVEMPGGQAADQARDAE